MDLLSSVDKERSSLSNENMIEDDKEYNTIQKSEVTGNEKIKILKHSLKIEFEDRGRNRKPYTSYINIAIQNISDIAIATALFEAEFYDIDGNILDTVQHKVVELSPNNSRSIFITYIGHEYYKIKGYNVRITRTTTSDIEKIQLRHHEIKTTEAGEEITGIVKNISDVKTDAAVIANFYNLKKENIGTKVIILRDIEPKCIKKYHCIFKPQECERVKSFIPTVTQHIEEFK
jgi:hypothetical protein